MEADGAETRRESGSFSIYMVIHFQHDKQTEDEA